MTTLTILALASEAAYADWGNMNLDPLKVLGESKMLAGGGALLLSQYVCPTVAGARVHQADTAAGFSAMVLCKRVLPWPPDVSH